MDWDNQLLGVYEPLNSNLVSDKTFFSHLWQHRWYISAFVKLHQLPMPTNSKYLPLIQTRIEWKEGAYESTLHPCSPSETEWIYFLLSCPRLAFFLQLYAILLSILEIHTLNCFSEMYHFTERMVPGRKGHISHDLH